MSLFPTMDSNHPNLWTITSLLFLLISLPWLYLYVIQCLVLSFFTFNINAVMLFVFFINLPLLFTIMSLSLVAMECKSLSLVLWLIILNIENKRMHSGIRTPGVKCWLHHFLALWPQVYVSLFAPSSPKCEEIIVYISESFQELNKLSKST